MARTCYANRPYLFEEMYLSLNGGFLLWSFGFVNSSEARHGHYRYSVDSFLSERLHCKAPRDQVSFSMQRAKLWHVTRFANKSLTQSRVHHQASSKSSRDRSIKHTLSSMSRHLPTPQSSQDPHLHPTHTHI